MVTSAKKPRAPRKKRATSSKEEEVVKSAAPEAEAHEDDAPMPKSYQNEPEEPVPSIAEQRAMAAEQSDSDEPDFGLGIGDILRNDPIKAPKRVASDDSASRSDAARLSIDSILRGEAAPAMKKGQPEVPSSLLDDAEPEAGAPVAPFDDEDADVQTMMPESKGGVFKTILLILLILVLFAAAAGGVYMFLSKNGVPPIIAKLTGGLGNKSPALDVNTPDVNEPVRPAVPENATVTVLVGLKQPEGESTKPFIVTRAVESDGKTSGTFPATGAASSTTDRATGTATIVNTTSREYTFVATTRLLSKEGVLFRMTQSTKIPANGSVDVQVRADQPGAEGDIGPTTFTIPGLPPDQQRLITAKSDSAMTGGSGEGVKGVSQSDIEAAKSELTAKLRAEAIGNFEVMLLEGEKLNPDMVTSTEVAATVPRVGTPGETFPASLSLRFNAMLMPEKDILPLLSEAMLAALPPEVSAADYTTGTPHYTVQAYVVADGVAEVRVDAPIIRR